MDTLIEMEMDIISLGGGTYDFKNFYRLVKFNFDAESNRKFKF